MTDLNDNLPPQDIELEAAVLGACMMERDAVHTAVEILDKSNFYEPAHALIFDSIAHLFKNYQPVDVITVPNELRKRGELEHVGGAPFIFELTNRVASAPQIEFHCRILKEKYLSRKMITICQRAIKRCFYGDDSFDIITDTSTQIVRLNKFSSTPNFSPITRINNAIAQIEAARQRKTLLGVPCGIQAVDKFTGGWQNQDLIVMAGRPGMGKTAIILSFAHAAAEAGFPTVIFSLEMSAIQIGFREVSMKTGIKYSKMRNGHVTDEDMKLIVNSMDSLSAPVFLDDYPSLNPSDLRSKVVKYIYDNDCKLIIIDYLNLMGSELNGRSNKYEKVTDTVQQLKQIAKQFNVPIILLAQLNREVLKETDKRPRMHHLRDTGAIEEYSDLVVLLNRPACYDHECDEPNAMFFDIAKHKQGATGEIKLWCEIEKNIIRDWEDPRPVTSYNPDKFSETDKPF